MPFYSIDNIERDEYYVVVVWRDGRVVEGAPLLREYGPKAHRGFESHSLRRRTEDFCGDR